MTKDQIYKIRNNLALTQDQFGQLLGVHPMTVSKWERQGDPSTPNEYQIEMMKKFGEAAKDDAAKKVGSVLIAAGAVAAIFLLLSLVMKKK